MTDQQTVLVANGLGMTAGTYFVRRFSRLMIERGYGVNIFAPFVDAGEIVRALPDGKKVADVLVRKLRMAPHEAADLVLIPCNSVHIANRYLIDTFGDRFVPINEAVISLIRRDGRRGRFLILGTGPTVRSGMYQEGLQDIGCDSVALPRNTQNAFDIFIFDELVSGRMGPWHLTILRDIEFHYQAALGADYVILACTELCYLVQAFSKALPWEIDSLHALGVAGGEHLGRFLTATEYHAH